MGRMLPTPPAPVNRMTTGRMFCRRHLRPTARPPRIPPSSGLPLEEYQTWQVARKTADRHSLIEAPGSRNSLRNQGNLTACASGWLIGYHFRSRHGIYVRLIFSMNRSLLLVISGGLILCDCSQQGLIPAGPSEGVKSTSEETKFVARTRGVSTQFAMRDLVLALPDVWGDVSPKFAESLLDKEYPKGPPEDFVAVEGEGLMASFTVARLESDLVSVAHHWDLAGEHDEVRVLRRTPNGWKDLTPNLFPDPVPKDEEVKVRGTRGGTISVQLKFGGPSLRYDWDGTQYRRQNRGTDL